MSTLIIVGLDRGDAIDAHSNLTPRRSSGRRLCDMICHGNVHRYRRIARVNLRCASSKEHGLESDRQCAANLMPLLAGRRVLLLGRNVERAFNIENDTTLTPWRPRRVYGHDALFASIPHPSARNLVYNDATVYDDVSWLVRDADRPCVHVEGNDGAGKSYLVQQLTEETGLRSLPSMGPIKSEKERDQRVFQRLRPNVIVDRSSGLISELVYGPTLRNELLGNRGWYEQVLSSIKRCVTFVYCETQVERLKHESRSDEDPEHVRAVNANLQRLDNAYHTVFDNMLAGHRVIRYDWTRGGDQLNILRKKLCADW